MFWNVLKIIILIIGSSSRHSSEVMGSNHGPGLFV